MSDLRGDVDEQGSIMHNSLDVIQEQTKSHDRSILMLWELCKGLSIRCTELEIRARDIEMRLPSLYKPMTRLERIKHWLKGKVTCLKLKLCIR